MSKSKSFGPGAYDFANGTYFHATCPFEKPSTLASAYATFDS